MLINTQNTIVTGMGAITPIAIGIPAFADALKAGKRNFSIILHRQGENEYQYPIADSSQFNFINHIQQLRLSETLLKKAKRIRNISNSSQHGIFCALEAWSDAGLEEAGINLNRVAIIVSGTNLQQATLTAIHEQYRNSLHFINPNYGLNFFDTDIAGVVSELLGIRGESHAIGAASASGNMAIIQAQRLINTGEYEVVIVLAPLMDLSVYELQGLTEIGAMLRINSGMIPDQICRPFDTAHSGFVYGQSAGCIVLESSPHASKRNRVGYGAISGYGTSMDANRNAQPSIEGESRAMLNALRSSSISASQIDYINTHGSASPTGDNTEVAALLSSGFESVFANSTKSLIGHALTAAGVIEAIATLLQVKQQFLHPGHNMDNPITDKINWVTNLICPVEIKYAMSNSFGFGGINTSVIIQKTAS
jgi:malonyl-ACP decarboxylase